VIILRDLFHAENLLLGFPNVPRFCPLGLLDFQDFGTQRPIPRHDWCEFPCKTRGCATLPQPSRRDDRALHPAQTGRDGHSVPQPPIALLAATTKPGEILGDIARGCVCAMAKAHYVDFSPRLGNMCSATLIDPALERWPRCCTPRPHGRPPISRGFKSQHAQRPQSVMMFVRRVGTRMQH